MGDPYLPPHWAAHRFRDIFDVLEATLEIAAAFLRDFVFWMDGMGNAFAAPLFLVLGVAQVITLMLHLRWQRPLAKRRRQGGKATTLGFVDACLGQAQKRLPQRRRIFNGGLPWPRCRRQISNCGAVVS